MAVGVTSRIWRWAAGIAGLAVLALAVAACDPGTAAPAGPPGPVTPAPTATLAPTETPISIGGTGGELYQQAHTAMTLLKSYQFVSDTDLGKADSQHIDGVWVAP